MLVLTAVTAVGGAVADVLPAWAQGTLEAVLEGAKWVWLQLGRTISLPVWAGLLLGSAFLLLAAGLFWTLRRLSQSSTEASDTSPVPGKIANLSETEQKIPAAFYAADDKTLAMAEVVAALKEASQLQIDKAADNLQQLGLLERQPHLLRGQVLRLTRRGRDFLVELEEEAAVSEEGPAAPKISDLQQMILQVFADRRGESVRRDRLEEETGANRLRVEKAAENLMDQGLLRHSSELTHGVPKYELTPAGRDFVLDEGWA